MQAMKGSVEGVYPQSFYYYNDIESVALCHQAESAGGAGVLRMVRVDLLIVMEGICLRTKVSQHHSGIGRWVIFPSMRRGPVGQEWGGADTGFCWEVRQRSYRARTQRLSDMMESSGRMKGGGTRELVCLGNNSKDWAS